jgi:DHA1 family multidrug resistance protein-like MFS transporter
MPEMGPSGRVHAKALAAILPSWAILLTFFTSNYMITPYLGLYTLSLGATTLYVGIVYAIGNVVSLIARLPFSALADKRGRRFFILMGLSCNMLAIALYALIQGQSFIIMARVLQGIALALFHPAILAYLVQLQIAGKNPTQTFPYTSSGAALGQSIGPALGAALFVIGSFLSIFLFSFLVSALGVALALISVREEGRVAHRPDNSVAPKGDRLRETIINKRVSLALYSRAAVNYITGMAIVLVPLLAIQQTKLSEVDVGILFTLAAIFNFIARPINARFSSSIRDSQFVEIGGLISAGAALLFSVSSSPTTLGAGMMLYGLGIGIFVPSSTLYVSRNMHRENITFGMGLITMMIDLGTAVGSSVSTLLLTVSGFSWAFLMAAVVGFSGVLAQRLSE